MLKSKGLWNIMMIGALAGWAFAIAGLVKPIENRTLKKIWNQVLLGWSLGHPLELLLALPIGKAAGLSTSRTVLKTLAFGFTWWVPLYLKVFKK
jgi:hypothetical protein